MKVLAVIAEDFCPYNDWIVGEAATVFYKYNYTHVICEGETIPCQYMGEYGPETDYPLIMVGGEG